MKNIFLNVLLVLSVRGDSPEEVRVLLLLATRDRSLGAVGHHHGPVVLRDPRDGLHCVGAGRTQHSNRGGEPGYFLRLDEVYELLHHDVRLALPVLDVEAELVVGQHGLVVINIVHCHLGNYNSILDSKIT